LTLKLVVFAGIVYSIKNCFGLLLGFILVVSGLSVPLIVNLALSYFAWSEVVPPEIVSLIISPSDKLVKSLLVNKFQLVSYAFTSPHDIVGGVLGEGIGDELGEGFDDGLDDGLEVGGFVPEPTLQQAAA